MPELTLLVDVLAVHRLTRLVTTDDLLDGPRDAVVRWAYRTHGKQVVLDPDQRGPGGASRHAQDDPLAPKVARLVTCRWCSSVHVATFVVVARRLVPRWWGPIAVALALSSASVLLAGFED